MLPLTRPVVGRDVAARRPALDQLPAARQPRCRGCRRRDRSAYVSASERRGSYPAPGRIGAARYSCAIPSNLLARFAMQSSTPSPFISPRCPRSRARIQGARWASSASLSARSVPAASKCRPRTAPMAVPTNAESEPATASASVRFQPSAKGNVSSIPRALRRRCPAPRSGRRPLGLKHTGADATERHAVLRMVETPAESKPNRGGRRPRRGARRRGQRFAAPRARGARPAVGTAAALK